MMKVVWLTQYNIVELSPKIKLNKIVLLHNSSWIHNLSKELELNKEIELHIITHSPYVDKTQSIFKNGINFHVIKYGFPFTNKGFPKYLPFDQLSQYYSFSKKAIKLINGLEPDVLHVHGTEGGYFEPTFNLKIPCIVSMQGLIGEVVKSEPSISHYLQVLFERRVIKNAKYFGCRTNFDTNYVKRRNSEAVIFDLPEAMNKIFFEKHWKISPGVNLLYVGSIMQRKGIGDLIHALIKLRDKLPEVHLRIIGSGTIRYINYIKKIIEQNNLTKNITLLGVKSPYEIALELTKCNFFVLPSHIDNSPNSLAEAMAVGVPCIATKVGGIPSMIEDRHDGMLFKKHDIDGLVNIVDLLVKDKELQNRISENARSKALERNYPSKVALKYFEVYKFLQNNPPS